MNDYVGKRRRAEPTVENWVNETYRTGHLEAFTLIISVFGSLSILMFLTHWLFGWI